MNLGADDYITKPVDKTDLLAAIRSRLERAVQQAMPRFKPNFHKLKECAVGAIPHLLSFGVIGDSPRPAAIPRTHLSPDREGENVWREEF
jgi:DNA-binding response OmpR family regulator